MRKLGLTKGDIAINALTYHLVPAGLLVDEALTSMGVTVVPSGTGNRDLQVQIMHDLKVTVFIGFPLFLMQVIKRAEELGYDFRRDFALRSTLALGKSTGRKNLEEDYKLPTIEVYGFLPIGVPAAECEHKSGMHFEEDFIVEIVDPATGKQLGPGEIGEVVVTTVFSEVMPRIRVGSGDLGHYTDEPCPCGKAALRITRILGRVGDAVRTRGMFIHPRQLEPAFSKFSEISKCQAVVARIGHRDELMLKVELKSDEGVDKENLTERLSKVVNEGVRIKVDRVEYVAKGVIPEGHKLIVDERVY